MIRLVGRQARESASWCVVNVSALLKICGVFTQFCQTKFRNRTANMLTNTMLATALCLLLSSFGAIVTGQDDFYLTNQIIPDLLTAPPPEVIRVLYRGEVTANKCNLLDPRNLRDPPLFMWTYKEQTQYALMLLDIDFPSRMSPVKRPSVHMLAMNITANDVYSSDFLFDYIGPNPMMFTGVHRYVFLVYEQSPATPSAPFLDRMPIIGRMTFDLNDFVKKYNLTGPVAGNCILAEFSGF